MLVRPIVVPLERGRGDMSIDLLLRQYRLSTLLEENGLGKYYQFCDISKDVAVFRKKRCSVMQFLQATQLDTSRPIFPGHRR